MSTKISKTKSIIIILVFIFFQVHEPPGDEHEHNGVEEHSGTAAASGWGGDPFTEYATSNLEHLGVGDDEKDGR